MKIMRFGEHLGWALIGLAAMLIILWFVLNLLATRTPSPISSGASWVGSQASGAAYGF